MRERELHSFFLY